MRSRPTWCLSAVPLSRSRNCADFDEGELVFRRLRRKELVIGLLRLEPG